ncbi:MAG: ABC transporter permease subunit [Planctomycetes bacterium]|nr:ABC transporter permease subunit [Planctomycetota bacterium]
MTRARRILSHFNPLSTCFGPVFEKEVYISGRRAGTYVVRGLAGLALLAVLGIACGSLYITYLNPGFAGALPNSDWAETAGGGALRLQKLQSTASILAAILGWFAYVLLLLVTPVFLAPCVMEEVRLRTLPALLTTPLTASDIILGKLFGRGVQILILALLPIPVLLIARTLGGIPIAAIFSFSAIIFASVLQMAAVSIAISVITRRSATAIVLAYCTWVAVNAVPAIAITYMSFKLQWFRTSEAVTMALAAPVAMGATTAQQLLGETVAGGDSLWIIASIYHFTVALLILTISIALMRRTMTREGAGISGSTSEAPKKQKRTSRPASQSAPQLVSAAPAGDALAGGAIAADAKVSAGSPLPAATSVEVPVETPEDTSPIVTPDRNPPAIRTVSDDPILWRELRTPIFRRTWHRRAAIVLGLALFLWITIGSLDEPTFAVPMVLGILLTIGLLQSGVLTTAAISTEREGKTWETLLTTPLSGGEILWSKLAAALTKICWPLFIGQAFVLAFGLILTQTAHYSMLLHWPLVFVGPCFFLACTGTFFGLIFKRSTVAAVFNLGLAFALWAVLPVVLLVIGQTYNAVTNYTVNGDMAARIALLINPYAWFGISIDGATSLDGRVRTDYDIIDFTRVPLFLFLFCELLFSGIYIALGFAVMLAAHCLFPKFSGRTPPEGPPSVQPAPISGR